MATCDDSSTATADLLFVVEMEQMNGSVAIVQLCVLRR